ncbi:MAG: 30S ribosomal protein S8 [Actinomycetota bacterium]
MRLATNVSDPIADLLTRIRNANLAFKEDLPVPASKMNEAILRILETEGFVTGFEPEGEGLDRVFRVHLKYSAKRERAISGLKRVSKPGRRLYSGRHQLPRVLGGLGIAIVSTSHGVMTDRDASRKGIGGEVLAYVW